MGPYTPEQADGGESGLLFCRVCVTILLRGRQENAPTGIYLLRGTALLAASFNNRGFVA